MAKNRENTEIVEIEEVKEKETPEVIKKVKTAGENIKLDVELAWKRNKKKVLIGAGVIVGAVVGAIGLKKFSEDGVIYDENGELVSETGDAEYSEMVELEESSETNN